MYVFNHVNAHKYDGWVGLIFHFCLSLNKKVDFHAQIQLKFLKRNMKPCLIRDVLDCLQI